MLRRRSLIWRVLAVFIVLLLLFSAVQRMPVGQQLTLGLSPFLHALQAPVRWWEATSLWFQERASMQGELLSLRQDMEQQTALIQQGNSLREENQRLRALLNITDIEGFTWHAAQVLGRSPDKKSQRLVLKAASHVDDVVVASTGLVGLVDERRRDTAVVRTILDASISVPVTLPNSPLAALVRGQGDQLLVDFIPLEQAPKIGAILQTSGAGGIFPPGIIVARVTQVEAREGRIFARIHAEPTAHWQRDNWLAIATRAKVIN